jgi:hypothetical protein
MPTRDLGFFKPERQGAPIDQGFVVSPPILDLVAGFRLLHPLDLGTVGDLCNKAVRFGTTNGFFIDPEKAGIDPRLSKLYPFLLRR